jgi:fructose-1,6-bisphosphatase II
MLDRDRHEGYKKEIREAGARLQLITDGDVAGALLAAWDARAGRGHAVRHRWNPGRGHSACAINALEGRILGRLWPRNDEERALAVDQGYDVDAVLDTNDLVSPMTASSPAPGSPRGSCWPVSPSTVVAPPPSP